MIFHGSPCRIQKCEYMAHACIVQSKEICSRLINYLSIQYQSPVRNPSVMRIRNTNSVDEDVDDCGDFGSGQIILSSLQNAEQRCRDLRSTNILVVVTCKVKGRFVVDMIQHMKHRPIMLTCQSALSHLTQYFDKIHPSRSRQNLNTALNENNVLSPVNTITFDPASIGIPDISQRMKSCKT